MLQKDMGGSTRGSCQGCAQTPCGVEEHMESIITPLMGIHVNLYYLVLSNAYFINLINNMGLCLHEELYLCVGDKDHNVAVGLTETQLGGYDSYVHGRLVGYGNARVLVQTCFAVTTLLYPINDEITTTSDAVGTFVIWLDFLLVYVNSSVSFFFFIYLNMI